MAFDYNKAQEQLIEIYINAYSQAFKEFRKLPNTEIDARLFLRTRLNKINNIIIEMNKKTKILSKEMIKETFFQVHNEVNDWFLARDIEMTDIDFLQINQESIEEITKQFQTKMTEVNSFVSRQVNDTYKRLTLELTAQKQVSLETIQQIRDRIVNDFKLNKIMYFTDVLGRRWSIESYSKMAIRTITNQSVNTAMINDMTSRGYDLVRMSSHFSSCEICSPFQDRVYSLTGKNKTYPSIKVIPGYSEGFNSIHPNCRHRITPYIEKFDEEKEQTIKHSNRPFEDDRSQASKDRYDTRQKVNRLANESNKLEIEKSLLKGKKTDKEKTRVKKINKRLNVINEQLQEIKQWQIDQLK